MIQDYYERYWHPQTGTSQEKGLLPPPLKELLGDLLRGEPAVLDVGCGDGSYYGDYVVAKAGLCYGLEISEAAVQRAKQRGIKAKVHDLSKPFPFPVASFDVVLCIEVLEHLFTPATVLAEVWRVLKPGGHVLVSVPNIAHFSHRLRLLGGKFCAGGSPATADTPWCDPHIRFFTQRSLATLLAETGFQPLIWRGMGAAILSDFPGLTGVLSRLVGHHRLVRTSQPFEFLADLHRTLFAGHLATIAQKVDLHPN